MAEASMTARIQATMARLAASVPELAPSIDVERDVLETLYGAWRREEAILAAANASDTAYHTKDGCGHR